VGSPALSERERISAHIVGREQELELLLAAVTAGCDVVLEGPPGTSKTTLLRAITLEWGIPLLFVEGNAELSPPKLLGSHDPSAVLREGYTHDNFVPGPLVEAMRLGGFLYIEEFNRAPEDTLNTLLSAIADREIAVPRLGRVQAAPSFRVVASMNPYDNIGTTRLSESVTDRLCKLEVTYQDERAERDIVLLRTDSSADDKLAERLAGDAVAVTRATRVHLDVRQGSSVRGAIDLLRVGRELLRTRGIGPDDEHYPSAVFDAMILALSGRIHVDEAADTTARAVLRQIWEDHFVLGPAAAEPG